MEKWSKDSNIAANQCSIAASGKRDHISRETWSPMLARVLWQWWIRRPDPKFPPIGNSQPSEVKMAKMERMARTAKTGNEVPPAATETTTGKWVELPICPFCSKDTVEYCHEEWRCRTCPAGTVKHEWFKNRFTLWDGGRPGKAKPLP